MLLHIAVLVASLQLVWATQGHHLRPLHRHLWNNHGHGVPPWYTPPSDKGKEGYWGSDCSGNGNETQSTVSVDLRDDEQLLWSSPEGM